MEPAGAPEPDPEIIVTKGDGAAFGAHLLRVVADRLRHFEAALALVDHDRLACYSRRLPLQV